MHTSALGMACAGHPGTTHRQGLVRWGMAGLLIVAFAARVLTLTNQSLWRDEVDALRFATAAWPELLRTFTRPGWNGPLYFVLLRGWIALTGQTEFALRYLSLMCGVVATALAFVFTRRLSNRLAAFLCSLFFALSPYFIWYSQEVKMYTLVLALAVLSIYALHRAIEPGRSRRFSGNCRDVGAGLVPAQGNHEGCPYAGRRITAIPNDSRRRISRWGEGNAGWWATFVVATSLAMYCHILAALLIPVAMLLTLMWGLGARAEGRWKGALVSFACLTLPYLPLLRWQLPLVLTPAQTGFAFYPLDQILLVMLNSFAAGVSGKLADKTYELATNVSALLTQASLPPRFYGGLAGMAARSDILRTAEVWPAAGLLAAGAVAGRARWRDKAALAVWLLLPPLMLFLVSLNRPIFTDRYLIWIGLAFYLLVALGAEAAWRLWRPFGALAIAAVIGVAIAGAYFQAITPIKSDFRSAARYLEARRTPDDLVIFQIPYVRYTFDYYYRRPYEWADGLFTNYGMSDAEVDAQMRALAAGRQTVWLVASEMEMWDSHLQVWYWLESHARRTDSAEFAQVTLYRYEF